MIGIYKITNPNGKIYIGQSINIEKRFDRYKTLQHCKQQIKLYNSFLKYGVNNHIFEIIEECEIKDLNKRERYWQVFYNVLINGLNLKLTKSDSERYEISNDSKNKIKNTLKKYFDSLTQDEKSEIYGKSSRKRKGKIGNRRGCRLTEEQKKKISESNMGRKVSDATKEKIRMAMINRVVTWGDKLSKAKRGVPNLKRRGKNVKEIIQFDMNEVQIKEWKSIREASNVLSIPFNSISNNLSGWSKSAYGFIWKYKNEKDDKRIK